MRRKQTPPTYESLLNAIATAPDEASLAALLQAAHAYFHGRQREELESSVDQRRRELPDGGASAG